MALLTFSQQQAIQPISTHHERYYTHELQNVEDSALRELLGAELLYDLQLNPLTVNNARLLDGDTYVRANGNTYKFKGVRYVLAFLYYAEYCQTSDIKDTFSGLVQKKTEESTPIPTGRIKDLVDNTLKKTYQEWEYIKEFLNLNRTQYPFWCVTESKIPNSPKYKFMQKTTYGN